MMFTRPKLGETEEDLLKQEEEFLKAQGKAGLKRPHENGSKREEKKSFGGVGEIIEKKTEQFHGFGNEMIVSDAFPKPFVVDSSMSSKREKKSLFALQMERNKGGFEQVEKPMEYKHSDRSYVVSGDAAEQIHKENIEMLSKMSEKEILEEQRNLQEMLNPDLIKFLKSRRIATKVEETVEKMEVIEESCVDVKENVGKYVGKQWMDLDILESDKLQWIGDLPDAKALQPDEPYSARFDFEGILQPFTANIDVRTSLHHHGDEPTRPGYTIQELYKLCRSTVLQQRILALNTLTNVIRRTKLGFYDLCFDGELLDKLIESDLFFLIRFAFDDNSTTSVAVKCLHSLFVSPSDEICLDRLLTLSDEQPLLSEPLEVDSEEEKELKDHVLISCDLVRGVLRTDVLLRLSYLLNKLSPTRETAVLAIETLTRIARHSPFASEEIIRTPNLSKFIHSCFTSPPPIYQSVKLFRILISHSKEIAESILTLHPMSKILTYIDLEDIPDLPKRELYFLKLECVRLLRVFNRHSLLVDTFLSYTPCFIRLLSFYIAKIDFSLDSEFDFELFSEILSLFRIQETPPDPHALTLIELCFEKWLKQLSNSLSYSFSNLKSLGTLFHFFSTYYKKFGVTETSLQYIAKINVIISTLLHSDVFDNISENLSKFSHIFHNENPSRDPKNLPSVNAIYKGGRDYVRIIQNQSPFLFFIPFVSYLKTIFDISHNNLPNIVLLLTHRHFDLYLEKGKSHFFRLEGKKEVSWFAKFELGLFVTIIDFLMFTNRDCATLAVRILSNLRKYDSNARKILSDICKVPEIFDVYSRDVLEPKPNSLFVPYKSDLVPKDWFYKPLLTNSNTTTVLAFLSRVLTENPELLQEVSYTTRFYRLSAVFLADSNIFDDEIQNHLETNFKNIADNLESLDLNRNIDLKKSFYDLYTEIIIQYAGLSYGSTLFAQFVLLPLQNRFDISYRKLLWFEYIHVLRVITVSDCYFVVSQFLEPHEVDESLLTTYLSSLDTNIITKKRNPFVYRLAIENIKLYLKVESSEQRLHKFLTKRILALKNDELKLELLT